MEKRLPLALFLSFLVLFGYLRFFGPKDVPSEKAEGTGAAGETDSGSGGFRESTATGGGGEPTDPADATDEPETGPGPVPTIAGEEPRTIEVLSGPLDAENGESHPGRYALVFSNLGGRLVGA